MEMNFNISHNRATINGQSIHYVEAGEGYPIIFLHGFPESWYSWRYQLEFLSERGFRVIALDQRGYGGSSAPKDIDAYNILHLVGDVIALMDLRSLEKAVVVGHDWGAPVAWSTALFRPDRIAGVVGLSVPYRPRGSFQPTVRMRELSGEDFYQLYFQLEGRAEADFEGDLSTSIFSMFYGNSADSFAVNGPWKMHSPADRGFFAEAPPLPKEPPKWLSEKDLAIYVEAFRGNGFRGPLNWYRNLDRNWELTEPWSRARITLPSMYLAGKVDPVVHFPGADAMIAKMDGVLPGLFRAKLIDDCGHWTQQEAPEIVNQSLLDFMNHIMAL
ncbi:unnamed protein product [Acidithrix sp. C25]|nr:unnamed protein product [Acidithrix sp. C25]